MNKEITVGQRLASMLLDHAIICFVTLLPAILILNNGLISAQRDISTNPISPYVLILPFSIYFCKDCIGGQSIAKRILKLQVADSRKQTIASPFQSLVRNFFDVLWPLEVIVIFFNPQRRIGDRVAGTKIIRFSPNLREEKTNFWQVLLCLVIAICVSYLLIKLFQP
jgi:uncharacterized RDD family membrane protein YckC